MHIYTLYKHISLSIHPQAILTLHNIHVYYLIFLYIYMYIIQRRVFSHWFSWLTSSAGKGAADEMDRLLREVRISANMNVIDAILQTLYYTTSNVYDIHSIIMYNILYL